MSAGIGMMAGSNGTDLPKGGHFSLREGLPRVSKERYRDKFFRLIYTPHSLHRTAFCLGIVGG